MLARGLRSHVASREVCAVFWQAQRVRRYHGVPASSIRFGQPVHETHPHLLQPGELTPGITALEYAQRRTRLVQNLPPSSIALLTAGKPVPRPGAGYYEFQQDANFFYLTGFNEPDAVAAISRSSDGLDHVFHLLVRPKDVEREYWEGPRSGLQAAMDVFNADETGAFSDAGKILKPLLASFENVYTDLVPVTGTSRFAWRLPSKASERSTETPENVFGELLSSKRVRSLKEAVHELRTVKSDAEMALMRGVNRASGRAFSEAMQHRWTNERDLMHFLEYRFGCHGCTGSAYVPVIAGGQNALSIHYTLNNAPLNDGDLVFVDAGGHLGHYVADISRTFPVSSKFSPAQRDLYEAILGVQRQCVSLCRANAGLSLDGLHNKAETLLQKELKTLGFDVQSEEQLHALFPHHVGHYLGLEIHDTPIVSRTKPLREHQVITIEPSIQVPLDDRWPKAFQGLGIQIEDSVVIGAQHPTVLSAEAPKEIDDIEALRAQQLEREPARRL